MLQRLGLGQLQHSKCVVGERVRVQRQIRRQQLKGMCSMLYIKHKCCPVSMLLHMNVRINNQMMLNGMSGQTDAINVGV